MSNYPIHSIGSEQLIQEINHSVSTQEKVESQERRHAARAPAQRRAHGQDVILSAVTDAIEAQDLAPSKKKAGCPASQVGCPASKMGCPASKASLPSPESEWEADQKALGTSGSSNTSIVALLGTVLALQAKCNSNYWSTMWQQATSSMQLSISMAPVIAQNVIANWNHQADMTDQEASMAKQDGMFALGSAGVSFAMGCYGAFTAEEDTAANAGATKTTEGSDVAESAASNAKGELNENLDENTKSWTSKVKRGLKAMKNGSGKATKGLFKALEKTAGFGQFSMAASNGMAQYFVDSPAKTQIALSQRAAGAADAASKIGEQYSQYYNQSFSRTEDLRQGAQQNINYAMEVLKSASDSVTQVSISMFRG